MTDSRYPRLTPARLIVTAFAAVISAGTALLMLPAAAADGRATGFTDAVFTATSATCVTGLITVDTATHWSLFGIVVITVLIQVGGLGIMTMASLVGFALIRRTGIRARLNLAAEGRSASLGDVRLVVVNTVLFSLAFEAVIAIVLALRFATGYGHGVGEAIGHGVFHAISAFNNAGFALYSDNVIGFVDDPWIILALAFGLISGGLGFPVWIELTRRIRRRGTTRVPAVWSMTLKMTLTGTLVLVIAGWVMVMAMEWNGALSGLDLGGKILAGFFQGVTPRTAGFNSVDYANFHDATLLGTDMLMFIGGGSAGTAGGIKITTLFVIVAAILAEVRGQASVHLFGRRVPPRVLRQALTVFGLGAILVVIATMVLLFLTEIDANKVMFEVVSAFGTVGLSTGITPGLPDPALWVLIPLMFLGRLGPITLVSSLAMRDHRRLYEYPEERPYIG